ncbi:MAG: recombinase family protein [Pyrinomonadaceae bacterium MAG19_C2-C3]|nr:recombinase family protein [Pyrinomonadaceae bacterium MAG19_C2-C3]
MPPKPHKSVLRVGAYARVSTHDQQTLPLQKRKIREYAKTRNLAIVHEYQEVGSGAKLRPMREELMRAARRREVDLIVVWKLDRWGRSVADLVSTLNELRELGVGFVSLTEALDFSTPSGRAMAGLLSVFAEFERDIIRERVKAGIAQARAEGRPHGRPPTARSKAEDVRRLHKVGRNNSQIARELEISRASVIAVLKS